jgi:hypothetical protein
MDAIANAIEKFKQSISQEDAHDFAHTELRDVWKAIDDIQNAQRQRQSLQNIRRIEPFLRGLENYSKVTEIFFNGTPHMSYIWVRSCPSSTLVYLLTVCS